MASTHHLRLLEMHQKLPENKNTQNTWVSNVAYEYSCIQPEIANTNKLATWVGN